MQVVCVTGPSDSGKTTVIERLLGVVPGGSTAATVKSIHHDVGVDDPGTDTYRHRAAGAVATVGVTPSTTFGFADGGRADVEPDAAALGPALSGFAERGIDYAFVEGFSGSGLPRVRVGAVPTTQSTGPVIARLESGMDADVEGVLGSIRRLRHYETAETLLDGETSRGDGDATAVVTVEGECWASPADWTNDDDGAISTSGEAIGDLPGVVRARSYVRPPLFPDGPARCSLSIRVRGLERCSAVAVAAGRELADAVTVPSPPEHVVRPDPG